MLLSLVAVLMSLLVGGPAGASGPTERCPLLGGIDPDFVRFLSASTIPVGGTHNVSVFASEIEAAKNLVTLTTTVRGSRNGGIATILGPVTTSNGMHDTTQAVTLAGTAGVTWRIDWVATFDFGVHVCTSRTFKHTPFFVTVV